MFVNISLKNILKSKWMYITLICIIVILAIYIFNFSNFLMLGKKINRVENTPFEINSYYAEYDMTVVSNKNVNTYFVKEWYIKDGGIKLELLDKTGNTFYIIQNNEKIYIENLNEKNKLTFNNLNFGKNVNSFSTLISIYECTKDIDNNCICELNEYEKEGKFYAYFSISKGTNKCNCSICNSLNETNISDVVVEINKENKVPLGFTVYDKDKNVKTCIVYTKFEMNEKINEEIFLF